MENMTLEELRNLKQCVEFTWANCSSVFIDDDKINALIDKLHQAISDKEFEEKTRPLNF